MKNSVPSALTIAGSDSGGGAGIQADLKTFAALRVHGTTAITALTAQNPRRVAAVQAVTPSFLDEQIRAVFKLLPPRAVKTGMLYSPGNIEVVAEHFAKLLRGIHRVVDPVMIATSGAPLLTAPASKLLKKLLLPRCSIVTPNLAEAAALTGRHVRSLEQMRRAARALFDECGCAALIKGGHLSGGREAADIFYDGRTELLLIAARVKTQPLHGAGCTYSAAITAHLALGRTMPEALARAKDYITNAILRSHRCRGHLVLNHIVESTY